jgi:hypothetical protein
VSPTPLSLASAASARENRALEFFYHNTAPQLSGCFGGSFWKGCIQQLALTEPSIRYAIIAIGVLHETKLSGLNSTTCGLKNPSIGSALQFYNKAINAITKRASTGADALPVVIVACIAFICFEGLWGRIDAALNHIKGGINLVLSHREAHGQPDNPWGQSYCSFQSSFLETELAPTLSSINSSIREFSQTEHFSLNPLDDMGIPTLGESFNNLSEARVGLLDLNNAGLKLFQASIGMHHFDENSTSTLVYLDRVRHAVTLWGINFESLIERCQGRWTDEEKNGMDSLRLVWLPMKIGVCAGVGTEDKWDAHQSDFEEVIRITESLIPTGNATNDLKGIPPAFSFETSLIDPLNIVAFKCRWPHVRRKALDLLLRVPRREYFFDAVHTHTVLSRIMEIEEASLNLPPDIIPPENALPPASARISYFFMDPQPVAKDDVYGITFLMKQNGTDAEWYFHKEHIRLLSTSEGNEGTFPRLRQVIYCLDDDPFSCSMAR